ncbi:hypothetical protein QOZ80_7AG0562330 [Eleusine coracana subsp. coracana]|nr:hypothetical protein QOZ80_7AG0562330 [Eleusine coracana subsp. coracana]
MAQLPRPAAVDVGTAKEDGASWEDALDVDDSDLRLSPLSSSRPLLSSSTTAAAPHPDKSSRPSHDQRIPGPASAIQDAMRVQDSGVAPFLRRADAQGVDADFVRHPWLCALQFLGKDRAWERPGIKGIKVDRELNRAPLVAGVVTSCKPNGVGDLLLTIKDPTDSIGASAHRKVLSEGNVGQDISVGCVILLHKVAVFRPAHTACYLNVTKGKLVKVVRKDCDPTFEQELSSCIIESQLPVGTWKVTQPVEHLGDKPFGTSEESASIFSKMVSRTNHTQMMPGHKEMTVPEPIPGASSVTPGDRACSQSSNNEKPGVRYVSSEMEIKNRNKDEDNDVEDKEST